MITVLPQKVVIPAQQIRIGAQKFKPLTPVEFKDDGILFTLRGAMMAADFTMGNICAPLMSNNATLDDELAYNSTRDQVNLAFLS